MHCFFVPSNSNLLLCLLCKWHLSPDTDSAYEQLEEIVRLASQPLPERPDGIVCVAKFTSATSQSARDTEAEYERMARNNPATIFLRCFSEYEDAAILLGQANVQVLPTFDMFYGGTSNSHASCPAVCAPYDIPNPSHRSTTVTFIFNE
jgi:hypothetical protein